MATRKLEFDYIKGKYQQKESDLYADDILVVHFRTPRLEDMELGGTGGTISVVAHKGPSATRHCVFSLEPEGFENPLPKGGPIWVTSAYIGFNKNAKYGIQLAPNTDYYWHIENRDHNGEDSCGEGVNAAVLVGFSPR